MHPAIRSRTCVERDDDGAMAAINSESFGTGGDGDHFEVEGSEVNSVAADLQA